MITPPLSLGMLEGVTRHLAIEVARGEGILVRQEPHGPEALAAADEVFVTSTIREVMPVTSLCFLESGEQKRVASLRNRFEYELATRVGDMRINGGTVPRVPNTSNVEFCGADGEALLIGLDLEGICVSSGAACASGSLTPSHVLTAMGLTSAQAHSSLRFSLGLYSTESEVDQVVDTLARQVPKARAAAA